MTVQAQGIQVVQGQVVIIKGVVKGNIKTALDQLKNSIVEATIGPETSKSPPITLIIDLSPFYIVSSTVFGTLGATIQEEHVSSVKLCGMRPMVMDALQRMGFIPYPGQESTGHLGNNVEKIGTFDSLEDGVLSIIPTTGTDK